MTAGTYAVVESAQCEEPDVEKREAELFVPLLKDVGAMEDDTVTKRRFYLANVEAITDVACVVPDIGGPPNRYFFVHQRPYWAELFKKWLNSPHGEDEMSDEEVDE